MVHVDSTTDRLEKSFTHPKTQTKHLYNLKHYTGIFFLREFRLP